MSNFSPPFGLPLLVRVPIQIQLPRRDVLGGEQARVIWVAIKDLLFLSQQLVSREKRDPMRSVKFLSILDSSEVQRKFNLLARVIDVPASFDLLNL